MAEALRLARKGLYTTDPNPRVGCVIVDGERIVGRGWHEAAGGPHAEIAALRGAEGPGSGCTAYLTLEKLYTTLTGKKKAVKKADKGKAKPGQPTASR